MSIETKWSGVNDNEHYRFLTFHYPLVLNLIHWFQDLALRHHPRMGMVRGGADRRAKLVNGLNKHPQMCF